MRRVRIPAAARPLAAGLLLAACAAFAQSGAAAPAERVDTLKRIGYTMTLTIGVRATNAPFSFVDAQNQPQGYSIDLCLRIADAVKKELKLPRLDVRFLPVTSANAVDMVKVGKIDLECGSTTNTRERQKDVAFTYTTFVTGVRMLARRKSNLDDLDDLRGKTVVVTRGSGSEALLRQLNEDRMMSLDIVEANDDSGAFFAVSSGRAAAFLADDVRLYGLLSKAQNADEFAIVGKYLSVEPYAIALRRDDPAFRRLVDRTLNEMFQSGEVGRIYARWFATADMNVPMSSYLKEALAVPNTYPAWP